MPGVRWLDGPDIRALEPDVAGVAALLSPTTAIADQIVAQLSGN